MHATNERPQQDWYWCDSCRDYFYGSAAIIHKDSRCHARDEAARQPDLCTTCGGTGVVASYGGQSDDLAGYPRLCTTCGGTGVVASYGGQNGDYDCQCPDCNGSGER